MNLTPTDPVLVSDAPTPAALDAQLVVHHAHLDVTLQIAAGEAITIMGPSGAGKSTLVHALAGLVRLDAGHITLGDRTLAASHTHVTPADRTVGLLGQDALLFPHMTAVENVIFAARTAYKDRSVSRRVGREWIARVGLHTLGDRRPSELSGGQRQRVALARALAARPQLLLLDEPFSSLDVQAAALLRDVIRTQRHGITTIVVSHTPADAEGIADRLVILENGHITQHGPVDTVLNAPTTAFTAAVAASRYR